jgi:hypothetical protein
VLPILSHLEPGGWGSLNLPRFLAGLGKSDSGPHAIVDDARRADVVLFIQDTEPFRNQFYRTIREHPLMQETPHRCFTWDISDLPCAILPGLYAALPRRAATRRVAGFCYLQVPNPALEGVHEETRGRPRDIVFSFIGAVDRRTRQRVFELRSTPTAVIENTLTKKPWFETFGADHHYADVLSRSRFVLCPRGHGTSSFRIFEAMQMGCVPVVIADEWLAPEGPDWREFSLHVRERDVRRIPSILAGVDSERMGARAREVWQAWYAPAVQLRRIAERLEIIQARTPSGQLGVPTTWPLMAGRYLAKHEGRMLLSRAATPIRAALRKLPFVS